MTKKGLIILDIDNTLIDTKVVLEQYKSKYPRPSYTLSKADTNKIIDNKELAPLVKVLIYRRPYLTQFLKYIFEHYHVGLWTAAQERWMDIILNKVLKTYKNKFLFKWHREHSTPEGKYMKPLKKIFEKYPKFNSSNTLIIDDNYTTTQIKISHLHIDRFVVTPDNHNKDEHLKIITKILKDQVKNKKFNPREVIIDYTEETD